MCNDECDVALAETANQQATDELHADVSISVCVKPTWGT